MTTGLWIEHPQVWVEWAGRNFQVDEGTVVLLLRLWAHGLFTSFSCQGWPDGNPNTGEPTPAYIKFEDPHNASVFYNLTSEMLAPLNYEPGDCVVDFDPRLIDVISAVWA